LILDVVDILYLQWSKIEFVRRSGRKKSCGDQAHVSFGEDAGAYHIQFQFFALGVSGTMSYLPISGRQQNSEHM
jgi:hypothetical protein